MEITDRSLISKLLISVMNANGGTVTLSSLEQMLDDVVNDHNAFPDFPEEEGKKVTRWNLEDHCQILHGSFMKAVGDLSKGNEHLNLTFVPRCPGCNSELKKGKATESQHVFSCAHCMHNFSFKIVHEAAPMVSTIDEDADDS
jgi:hypothetical protein